MPVANSVESFSVVFSGYHGTDEANCAGILEGSLRESEGENHWAGKGVYFFVKGVSDEPQNDAAKWAIAQAWDKDTKRYKYNRYAVFEGQINCEEDQLLDLTYNDGLKILNQARQDYVDKMKRAGFRLRGRREINDSDIIEAMKEDFGIEVVKGNFYIRFKDERRYNVFSRIANITLIAVSKPHKHIPKNSLKIVRIGEIRP